MLRLSVTCFALFALASAASVETRFKLETIRDPPRLEEYETNQVHKELMALKMGRYGARQRAGEYESLRYSNSTVQAIVPCTNGVANGFKCKNFDLLYYATHAQLGSTTGEGSSSWGWVSSTGKEIAIIAQADGAAFAEVKADGSLDYLGRLPNTNGSSASIWRELRVMGDLLVVGSEATNHHVQIFNLNKVLNITAAEKPKRFNPTTDVEAIWRGLPTGRAHNIVVNAERKYAVAVGAQPTTHTYRGGLVFIDLKDPKNPVLAGYQAADGYVHDAQCLVYRGPDTRYQGRDVCYGFNEDTLTIYDVTSPANATIISRTSYTGASYTHQGWVLDPNNQQFLLLDDEYDEYRARGAAADGRPVTYIWNIKDLRLPVLTGYYKSSVRGVDHNQYVDPKRGWVFQSNYGNGLRVLDISSIPSDPTGAGVKEVGFFDVYPEDDNNTGGGVVDFVGSWSSYGLFPSGNIIINTIERGAFVVKYNPGTVA